MSFLLGGSKPSPQPLHPAPKIPPPPVNVPNRPAAGGVDYAAGDVIGLGGEDETLGAKAKAKPRKASSELLG